MDVYGKNLVSMQQIPRLLTRSNIDEAIRRYLSLLDDIPLSFSAKNILSLFVQLKRTATGAGPYPQVSLFELANRVMTDLVILYGVKSLLTEHMEVLGFDEYKVEYGTENKNDHDILASKNGRRLHGEAFNVSPSFFQAKKAKTLKKLRAGAAAGDLLVIMYNSDAVGTNYEPSNTENEIHLPVTIRNWK